LTENETTRRRCDVDKKSTATDRSPVAAGYEIGGRFGATAPTRPDGETSARGKVGAAWGRGLPCAESIPMEPSYTAAADRVRLRKRTGVVAAPVPRHRPVRRDVPNRRNFCTQPLPNGGARAKGSTRDSGQRWRRGGGASPGRLGTADRVRLGKSTGFAVA
jgi:hypothetical protein